jgi:serine/threonine-protein kinase SRPK3
MIHTDIKPENVLLKWPVIFTKSKFGWLYFVIVCCRTSEAEANRMKAKKDKLKEKKKLYKKRRKEREKQKQETEKNSNITNQQLANSPSPPLLSNNITQAPPPPPPPPPQPNKTQSSSSSSSTVTNAPSPTDSPNSSDASSAPPFYLGKPPYPTRYNKYLIKLADFGNACWCSHHFTDNIQTRYEYNISVGCEGYCFYEVIIIIMLMFND